MKIAIAATGPGLDSPATGVFGRAPYFVVVETDGNNVRVLENLANPAAHQARSAGIIAAQALASKGVDAVVSGNVGPNAYTVLTQAGIRVFMATPGTVKENAVAAAQGKLQPIMAPQYGPGPGMGPGYGRGMGFGRGRGLGRGGGWGRGPW